MYNSGVEIIPIAVGDNVVMSEIQNIATNPDHIYQFSTFEELSASDLVHDGICEGNTYSV